MKVKLGELTKIKTGKLDANAASEDGKYPFFTCSKEPLKISTYSYDCECVLVAGNGDLNAKYYNGKFDAYQRTYIIESNGDGRLYLPYLYYFMTRYLQELRKLSIGGVIKYIKLGNLTNAEIQLPDISRQKEACERLRQIKAIINKKSTQLNSLDNLVKARFVEMFGNVVVNDKSWATKPISSVAPASSPKIAVSENIWLLNLDMIESQSGKVLDRLIVSKNKINASTCAFDDKNVLYSKLRPYLNKVVLPDQEGYCTTELAPLRPSNELNREFLATLLRSDAFVGYINEKTAGAKMPRVSMNIFRQFECILPPITLQEQFSVFYKQVDKSKFVLSNELTMCDFYIRLIHDRVMHGRINLRVAQ